MIYGAMCAVEETRRQRRIQQTDGTRVEKAARGLRNWLHAGETSGEIITIDADVKVVLASLSELAEALRPFAALAAERYPEEGGAISTIDIMTLQGEWDELELRGSMAVSRTTATLDGSDFRNALRVLTEIEGKKP